ncbi:MAG: GNAT family N-acetyltransferase [Actinobacteria bacterium]|nr:GNAT family N-acetyltransferase [Actinomycetota bacterium]
MPRPTSTDQSTAAPQAPAGARRGPAVALRPPGPADRDAFIAAMLASAEHHRPWVTPPVTVLEYDAWLTRTSRTDFDANLAIRPEDGAIVGYFNVSQIIRGPLQSAFLGYGGVAEWSGAGYMTAALRLVLERSFTDLALHRVEANIQPGNGASIALVERCGFVREGFSERYLKIGGHWRDHLRYAIRTEQWRS